MITLVILDGCGENKNEIGNAILSAGTPNIDKLKNMFSHTTIEASGEYVGLPKGQMGNSEVGHLNLGAGKIVYQDLVRINNSISSGEIKDNKALIKAINHAKQNNSTLHFMGLFSDGGVHSQLSHLQTLIEIAQQNGIEKIAIHAFTDGRDTPPKSATDLVKNFKYSSYIKSVMGRVFAMDREKRYDRIELAYKTLVLGKSEHYCQTAIEALEESYKKGLTDEFVRPAIIGTPATICDNDAVIFYNFRSDRAREITDCLTNPNFDKFKVKHINNLCFVCMTEYDATLNNVELMFPPITIENNLAHILAENGLKQYHISETTKYAHVTFFFNGGIEKPNTNEERELIESYNTLSFADFPEMKANEIMVKTIEAIASNKYDFILVNFSNLDMLGHTGNFEATKQAVKLVDKCAYLVAMSTLLAGGSSIITADHGNAEQMIDEKGNPHTAHTTNPVPFILVDNKYQNVELKKDGKLANVAPTILKLLNIDIPKDMEKPMF